MLAFEPYSSRANPKGMIFPIGHHLAGQARSPLNFLTVQGEVDAAPVAGNVLKSRPLKNRSEKMKHQYLQYEVREVTIGKCVYE